MTALTKMTRLGDRKEKHRRDVRRALLQAADQIEREPGTFSFSSVAFSESAYLCDAPFCALGWIAWFFGLDREKNCRSLNHACELMFGFPRAGRLYSALDEINPEWSWSAEKCADTLRKYADRDFPTPSTFPDGVTI